MQQKHAKTWKNRVFLLRPFISKCGLNVFFFQKCSENREKKKIHFSGECAWTNLVIQSNSDEIEVCEK
jgi:hypothetical protein